MIVLTVKYSIVACFFHRYTFALLRFMLFNCNLSKLHAFMVLPFGTFLFLFVFFLHNETIHVLATHNVWGYLVVMISDLCTFVKLSLGSCFG